MKKTLYSLAIAVATVFFSVFIIMTIISDSLNYSSVETSYHAVTHSLLISLIFLVSFCLVLLIKRNAESRESN